MSSRPRLYICCCVRTYQVKRRVSIVAVKSVPGPMQAQLLSKVPCVRHACTPPPPLHTAFGPPPSAIAPPTLERIV